MTAINIKAFRGKTPAKAKRLLNGNVATEALNCRVHSGALTPIRGSVLLTTLPQLAQSLFRYRGDSGQDYWLQWNRTVDAVRSPTAQDPYNRVYWTGDGEPRMGTNTSIVGDGVGVFPEAWFVLGVYRATAALVLTSVTGGTAPVENRAYVYTFVTRYGEEGPPCLTPLLGTGNANGTWNLSSLETPPLNTDTLSAVAYLGNGISRVSCPTTRGMSRFDELVLSAVGGIPSVNGQVVTVNSVVDATHFDIVFTPASGEAYTSGGTWGRRAPHNVTAMKKRIYRNVGTNTDYKFVGEIDATQTTFADSVASTLLGAVCPTVFSDLPPKNLHSIRALANGSLGGIAGNQVCFSEPYKPYSWPQANRYAFSGIGVGTAAVGNALIVLTDSYPIMCVATDPSQVSPAKMRTMAPCFSKRGIVDAGDGAIYPGPDGLYFVSPQEVTLLTEKIYRQEDWLKINPATFVAAYYGNRYYAVHTAEDGKKRVLILDRLDGDGVTELDDNFDTLVANQYDGRFYGVKSDHLYLLDEDDGNRYTMFWQSAEFQMGKPTRMLCAQVHGEYGQLAPPNNTAVAFNDSLLVSADNILGAWGLESGLVPFGASNLLEPVSQTQNRVQLNVLKDGRMSFGSALNSSDPFRLPGGERAELYQLQIVSSIPVYSVTIAESMRELGQASQ